jgi:hypothetical protein
MWNLVSFGRFLVAHTVGSLAALLIFLIPMFAPYAPVALYMRWQPLLPHMLPMFAGLGIAIWVLTLPLVVGINYVLRCTRLVTQQDYVIVGFTVGLLLSIPFVNVMGMNVVDTAATPVVTQSWLLMNQMLYVMAWAVSGVVYGVSYYYFHSERIR